PVLDKGFLSLQKLHILLIIFALILARHPICYYICHNSRYSGSVSVEENEIRSFSNVYRS
ncbi:MAG: hypothetical protein RLZZ519_2631, partial [Bacteroidota bacterium]